MIQGIRSSLWIQLESIGSDTLVFWPEITPCGKKFSSGFWVKDGNTRNRFLLHYEAESTPFIYRKAQLHPILLLTIMEAG